MNCSKPCLLSSMKDSSKMPSSPRKGSWRFKALPGSGGTTIWKQRECLTGEQNLNPSRAQLDWWKKSISVADGRKFICINFVVKFRSYTEWILSFALTLLSRSNSFFSHSKSLYRRLTQDSFSLKMGRFVCKKTHSTQQLLYKSFLQLYNTFRSTVQWHIYCVPGHKGSQSRNLSRAKHIDKLKK